MAPQLINSRRAILKKSDSADVSVAVLQDENGGFEVVIDGVSGASWPKYTPEQLMLGDTPQHTLDGVWNSLLSKYPGYEPTEVEEIVPTAA